MTAKRTATDLEQGNGNKSSRSRKLNKGFKPRKRQTFLEAWNNAVTRDAAQKAKRHYSWTENEAFNDLIRRYGENFFEIIEKGNTLADTWETRWHITPPRNLLSLYQDPSKVIGLRFGYLTRVLLIDVDTKSPYHPAINKAAFDRLLLTLEEMGLARYRIVRSSDSGGLHIIIGLNEPLPSWLCANTLYVFLTKAGFNIGKGILEIFPNRKQCNASGKTSYHGIRLPLQPNSGSVVLDSLTLEPLHTDLNCFVGEIAHDAQHQDLDTFKALMKAAYEDFQIDFKGRVKARTGKAQAWLNDMQERINKGFTASGQTNDLILEVGKVVFVFHKLDGQAAVDAMATWIQNLPGYAEHCHHQHELERRCWDWHKCITKLYYKYEGTFKERAGINYGETVQAIAATLEDGRRHNQANKAKEQAGRDKLAAVFLLIRREIRQGLLSIPKTVRGWLDLLRSMGKRLFEQGFSYQSLYRCKSVVDKLKRFALRWLQKQEALAVAQQEPEATPALQVVTEPFETPETGLRTPLQAGFVESECSESPETGLKSGVTGNFAIYEGGVELNSPQGNALVDVWRQAGTVLVYTGSAVTGVVTFISSASSIPFRKCKVLRPNSLVQLTSNIHSMESSHGLVYVRPVGKKWLEGIPVLLHSLIPGFS